MSKKLVSIITPCYNGSRHINSLLNSVLAQTYPSIEMIIINDGSTDNSAEIIKSFIPRFAEKGYKLNYVYQDNQGQSVAINNALKLVSGQYLVWPDADDYYSCADSISIMADTLTHSDDQTSMIRVQYNILDEVGQVVDKLGVNDNTKYKVDLFEDAVFGANGFWYPPGGYMAKVSKIDELIPGREIYTEKNAGQNFQLYLPLLYQQKCLTIEGYLYNIVAHDDSHSRSMSTHRDRQNVYRRTIIHTLDKMLLDVDYKRYLVRRVRKMTSSNIHNTVVHRRPYRKYFKQLVKAILPHGVIVLYKRSRH